MCKVRTGATTPTSTLTAVSFSLYFKLFHYILCLPESIFSTVPGKECVRKGCYDARLKPIDDQFVQSSSLFGGAIKEGVQQDAVEGDIFQEDGHA